jgi:osmoprotectant transport system substrate-binding protein
MPLRLGLALAIAFSASAATARATPPTIAIGTKNFPEEFVLGQLYKQALEAQGFRVSYKESIGPTELIDAALTSGQINFYPEYTGTIVSVLFHRPDPGTAARTYALAKRFEARRGFTLLRPTAFSDSDEIAVLRATARRHLLRTIGDLHRLPNARVGGEPEGRHRYAGLVGLNDAYHLTHIDFIPFAGITPYAGLDAGRLDAAFVFSTDAELGARSPYVVLADTKHIFGFQNVAPVVSRPLVRALGPKFTETVNAVSRLLTLRAVIAMNRAVTVDKQTPADVASAFLRANRLE